MKTIEALNAQQALARISGGAQAVPLKFAYAAVRNARKLDDAAKAFEQAHKPLFDKYVEKDADGNPVSAGEGAFKLSDPEGYFAAVQTLYDMEIGVELYKVSLDHFPKDIDLAAMNALMAMVDDDA